MSHLIMLAPANFGSALAQIGKGKLNRLKTCFDGLEPGQGILDWLELGSEPSWNLNKQWILSNGKQIGDVGIFPFVIIGQSIDRKLYDTINSYTGELGTDGVVRIASGNLNAQYLKLSQPFPKNGTNGNLILGEFIIDNYFTAPKTAIRIVSNKSHTGEDIGILKSVKKELTDTNNSETIEAIFNCIQVSNNEQYYSLIKQFQVETINTRKRID